MGSNYIKNLVSSIRDESKSSKEELSSLTKMPKKYTAIPVGTELSGLLESLRGFKVEGEHKRLIRIDDRNEEVLKLLPLLFKIEVTSFINFLCLEFLEKNPELIKEIKESLKNIQP